MNAFYPRIFRLFGACALAMICCQCATKKRIIVSVAEQRMVLMDDGELVKSYPVSTSRFGLGDRPGSKRTPVGTMRVAEKIGRGAPAGAVFKSRERTGEVLRPNAPGRDPIVTRILWLEGTQAWNRNAYRRYIYIHGTPEENKIGSCASFGCIRMRSRDVIDLFRRVRKGTPVEVVPGHVGEGVSQLPAGTSSSQRRP